MAYLLPRLRVLGSRSVGVALCGVVLAVIPVLAACAEPYASRSSPTPVAIPHQPTRVIDVIPDGSAQKLHAAEALAEATVETLDAGDSLIVVRESDFSVVTSQVVPGQLFDQHQLAICQQVSVGGVSLHCQQVDEAERQLEIWRTSVVELIQGLQPKPSGRPADDCRVESGWPRDAVMQLLLSFQDDPKHNIGDVLILGGGDADARGNTPRLPASYVAHVEVVVAPYTMSCGNPSNISDWFRDAASVRLFGAERPAAEFPQFLFDSSQATAARSGS